MISAKEARARKGAKSKSNTEEMLLKMFLIELNKYIEDISLKHDFMYIDITSMYTYSNNLDICKIVEKLINKGYFIKFKNNVLTIDWSGENNDKKK